MTVFHVTSVDLVIEGYAAMFGDRKTEAIRGEKRLTS